MLSTTPCELLTGKIPTELVGLCRRPWLMMLGTVPSNGWPRRGDQLTNSTPLHRLCAVYLVGH